MTITEPANSAVIRRNVRSPKFASRPKAKRSFDLGRTSEASAWMVMARSEQLLAAGGELLQASLHQADDLLGQWRVVQRLRELLAVVKRPPQVLRDGFTLHRVDRKSTRLNSS